MSGLFAQVGFANETVTPPVSTAGTSTAAAIGGTPFVNLLTFGSNHGLAVGSVITLAGYTPSAWNGQWMVSSVPSATTLNFLSATSLGPVTVHGTSTSSIYGSTVSGTTITPAPSRFTTFLKESMKLSNPSIQSMGVGANRRVQSSTRGVKNREGANGTLEVEAESKGLGFWLKHLVGPVVTTGPTDSAFTHTASFPVTLPGMLGSSFNMQGTVVPVGGGGGELVKTYIGCKVTSWEFDCAVGQLLTFKVNIDAMDELRNITKATASYPVNPELLSFAGATIQIAGSTWDVVTKVNLKCDMGYKADRRFARANTLQKEPAEEKFRQIDVTLEGEFDNVLTAYNRIADTTYANSIVQINLAFVGKILIGVSTFPSLTFNMSVAELQDETPTTDGPVIPVQKIKAGALYDGTNSPLTIAYVTTDATP
jgi:hypothetical protein